MDKEITKMIPGDELHLTMLMAPYSLNLVTGQDRQHLLAFGRAAFEAGKADRTAQCLHHIAEPETAASMLRQCIGKATFPTNMDKHSALQWIDQLEAEVDAERRHHGIRNASAVRTLHELGYSWRGADAWHPAAALAEVHPDDAAVDALAVLMKAKLAEKRAKGYGGWNDKTQCPQQRLSDMLRAHVDKGDPVDVANFCAMLSARGEGIAAALHPMPAVTMYGKCYEKTFAAPRAVQAAVPDGYAVVSVEKINAAIQRASVFDDGGDGADPESARSVVTLLRDMLTAAPAHPAEAVPAQGMDAK